MPIAHQMQPNPVDHDPRREWVGFTANPAGKLQTARRIAFESGRVGRRELAENLG